MKKLIAIVLTIALFTCLFAGCSSKTTDHPATQPAADAAQTQSTSESTSSETTTSSESGEFTLYAWGDAHWNEYVQVQDLFNSLYPDYKMTYMQENSLTDLLITKAAQNALPDMFYAEPYVGVSEWAEVTAKICLRFICLANATAACAMPCSFLPCRTSRRFACSVRACPSPTTLPWPGIIYTPRKNGCVSASTASIWFSMNRTSACAIVRRIVFISLSPFCARYGCCG